MHFRFKKLQAISSQSLSSTTPAIFSTSFRKLTQEFLKPPTPAKGAEMNFVSMKYGIQPELFTSLPEIPTKSLDSTHSPHTSFSESGTTSMDVPSFSLSFCRLLSV